MTSPRSRLRHRKPGGASRVWGRLLRRRGLNARVTSITTATDAATRYGMGVLSVLVLEEHEGMHQRAIDEVGPAVEVVVKCRADFGGRTRRSLR